MIDTDTLEELKIIAQDGGRLDDHDKGIINQAVIQLEAMEKLLFNANKALAGANAALTGANMALSDGKKTMQHVHAQLEATQHWPRPAYTRVTLRFGAHEQTSLS